MALKILLIGGTGILSSACAALALEKGHILFTLTRGQSERPLVPGAQHLKADIHDPQMVAAVLGNQNFDVIVDFIAYTPADVERDIALFKDRTAQYVFISSASAYQKPPQRWPITEDLPLKNPFWTYSQNKIRCEERLMQAYREADFPVTIVRPSHTYDARTIPLKGGYTNMVRLTQGKPIVLHGDGTSLWTLTHHQDFAKGLVGLLGLPQAVGEAFHITSDEVLTWNQIAEILARAFNLPLQVVHIPSTVLARYDAEWGGSLLGDKQHCLVFDNSKIKRFVPEFQATIPFVQGAQEMADWFAQHPEKQKADPYWEKVFEQIVNDWYQKPAGGKR